jgi:hypothetical protein
MLGADYAMSLYRRGCILDVSSLGRVVKQPQPRASSQTNRLAGPTTRGDTASSWTTNMIWNTCDARFRVFDDNQSCVSMQ